MAEKLYEAIYNRRQKEVRKILKGKSPNELIDWLKDGTLVGPPLVLAIDNLDTSMIKVLVEEFGADVNQEIIISGNTSTLLIYAVKCLAG